MSVQGQKEGELNEYAARMNTLQPVGAKFVNVTARIIAKVDYVISKDKGAVEGLKDMQNYVCHFKTQNDCIYKL